MLGFLPFLTWLALCFLLWARGRAGLAPAGGWRGAFITAVTVWWAFLALITELLGAFQALHFGWVLAAWLSALAALVLWGWRSRLWRRGWNELSAAIRARTALGHRLAAGGLIAVSLLALLAAVLLAPPNTNDSLAYHMPRVMHWIQNGSLAHYPTVIDRQLWNPPGAEYAILHLVILAGGDRLANLVQWFSLLAVLVTAGAVASLLGGGRRAPWLAALAAVTLPMAVVQASSTQNDLVTSWWVVCLAHWVILAGQRRLRRFEWLLLSLAVGMGILTKGTFYAFAAPLLLWLLVSTWRRQGWKAVLGWGALGLLVVLLLNGGLWVRNWGTYRSLLGPANAVQSLANEVLSPAAVLSNTARNLAAQLATPVGRVNQALLQILAEFHRQLGLSLDDPRTSLEAFSLRFALGSEDFAANPLHMVLVLILWLVVLVRGALFLRRRFSKNSKAAAASTGAADWLAVYSLVLLVGFVLFSTLYKWQPWGVRLILPFFILAAPAVGVLLEGARPGWVAPAVVILLWAVALLPLLANNARPLLPLGERRVSVFTTPRTELLFMNAPTNQDAYTEFSRWVGVVRCQELGLVMRSQDAEYPLWALLSPSGMEVRIEHLVLSQSQAVVFPENFKPCAVFVSVYDFDTRNLPGFSLAESRLGFSLFVLDELRPLIR